MKKLFILGVGLLFAGLSVQAQNVKFGLKGGVNLAKLHTTGNSAAEAINDSTKYNVGFNLTGFADIGVTQNFYIQPGISLQNKGTKIEGVSGGTTGSVTANVMAIEIPVNLMYSIPTGTSGAFQISAGPYASFNISGKTKTKLTTAGNTVTDEDDLSFGDSEDDNFSSTEFGTNFGLTYRMSNGFQIGGNYGLGLSNWIPKADRSGDNKVTSRVLGFTVGYSF